ncbi:hypothetical protein ES703_108410 [subsurface metagenome]
MDNIGIPILHGIIMLPGSKARQSYFKVSSNLTQLAQVSLITNQTGIGVAGHHQFYQNLARLQDPGGMGIDDHTLSDWSMAGANQSP